MNFFKNNSIPTLFLLLLTGICCLPGRVTGQSLLPYVHPEIGSAQSRWFFYTPAAMPQGMAKLAPSTNGHYGNASGWEAVGYDPRDKTIEAFVDFHEWQLGGLAVMAANGPLFVQPGDSGSVIKNGYRSHFQHKNEVAEPGYYKVLLDDYGITAELTATDRVGYHKFTFPASQSSRILLDIGRAQGESGEVKDASIRMTDGTHFEGYVKTYPKYLKLYDPTGEVSMYFWGEVSKAPATVGSFTSGGIHQDKRAATGKGAGLFLNYTTGKKEAVTVKIGLSYTSIQNAALNFKKEAAGLSFAAAKMKAQQSWEKALGRIKVEGGGEARKIKFYTGLYHSLLGRGMASDVNGAYPKANGQTGYLEAPVAAKKATADDRTKAAYPTGYHYINTDAIWGTYWNLTQLWALSYPHYYRDLVHTQLQLYKDRGWFGDGIVNSQYASGVGTNFVGLIMAAAYQCGLLSENKDTLYAAIRKNELGWQDRLVGAGKSDTRVFTEKGFVPFISGDRTTASGSSFSASHTLEYSFSAFAAAQLAKVLGKEQDYKTFSRLSGGWQQLWDTSLRFIHPKDSTGNFIDNFKPEEPWRGFQEGNAIQYSYFVPQNPAGLITAIGKDSFNQHLNEIFETSAKNAFGGGRQIDAFAGVHAVYNHGNQPDMQMSWLFNFSGKPWLTQKWSRAICDVFYGTEMIHGYGYGQDEDQGQLGAWYVMSSLGLFDVKGLTDRRPVIEFGSPGFDKAVIELENGKRLTIETDHNATANVFVQSATWNGKPLTNCWMYRDQLMQGGTLHFKMGDSPNKDWGVKETPPSLQ